MPTAKATVWFLPSLATKLLQNFKHFLTLASCLSNSLGTYVHYNRYITKIFSTSNLQFLPSFSLLSALPLRPASSSADGLNYSPSSSKDSFISTPAICPLLSFQLNIKP